MSNKRKIFVVTERRADFSRFKPILELIKKDNKLDLIFLLYTLLSNIISCFDSLQKNILTKKLKKKKRKSIKNHTKKT